VSEPTQLDWAYLAGIVDGEGSICAHSDRRGYLHNYPALHISNTDPRLIEWILDRFGGSILLMTKNRNRPFTHIMWTGKRMEPVLVGVLPFLVIKKEQAETALSFRFA
jgi:hypothetical protein